VISFRLEKAGEAPLIHDLVHRAFGQEDEARLVRDLCADGDALVSMVALQIDDGQREDGQDISNIVGHVLFCDVPVQTDKGLLRGAGLAPLSVDPDHQKQGVGGGLVMQGLKQCRDQGLQVVLVLGDPAYYGRFGFSATLAEGLASPFAGPAFQALELEADILQGTTGKVLYPGAFSNPD
jgi:putative acetyltransferase